MKPRSQAEIGALCVFVFVLCSAFRDVYFGGVFQSVSVFLVLSIAFGTMTLAGLTISVWKDPASLRIIAAAPKDAAMMNLATAGAWTCYFFALKFLDPSIVNTLFAGIGPFVVIALAGSRFSIAQPSRSTPLQRILQAGVVFTLLILVWIVVSGRSGFQSGDAWAAFGSAMLALVAGSLITVGHLLAKRLDERGAAPPALLGTRFFGLLAVAACGIAYEGMPEARGIDTQGLFGVAAAAVLLIVMPVWFNQVGMAKISPLSARVITAFGPVLVFGLQQFDTRITWSTETFVAVTIYSALVTVANLSQRRDWNTLNELPMPRHTPVD
jgi:drug/metabolite transporter (DMT)-like permease